MTKDETEDNEEKEFREAWQRGVPVDVDIDLGLTNILSVRLLPQTHAELTKAAKKQGIAPAKFARQAIEEKIAMSDGAPASILSEVLARLVQRVEALEKGKA